MKTESSRDALSAFLVKPAKQAVAKSQRPTAIVLYQALAVARGAGSPEARQLADLWRLVGGDEQAVAVLKAFIAASSDGAAVADAQKAMATIKPDPYAKPIKLPSQDKLAKVAFKNGRAAFKKKKYGDALIDYQMGYALAPDLPGFLRELGATYDKLGAKDKKGAFYLAYLRRRPFGKNADAIRKELGGADKSLGTLSISASLPCTEVVIAAEDVPGKLPMKDIAMAPGDYVGLCFNPKYAFGEFLGFSITAGQKTNLVFNWAIVVNKLENPLGRIAIENANKAGQMIDLGVEQPELGVVVPDDGHALKVELRDDEGVKSEERYLKLEPGQTQIIKW